MKKYIFTEEQIKKVIDGMINETEIDEIDLKGDKFGGNVALRKLSYKSKWDFNSKHQGLTIEEVMKFFPKSLYWAYTHLEKISFVDDVLFELANKFPKTFRRIDKPGIDKEQYEEYTQGQNPYAKFSYPELSDMLKAKVLNNEKIDGFFYREYKKKKYEFQKGQFKAHSGRDEMSAGKMSVANQGHVKMDTLKPKEIK